MINENTVAFFTFFQKKIQTNTCGSWFFASRFQILQTLVCFQWTILPHYERCDINALWPFFSLFCSTFTRHCLSFYIPFKCAWHSQWVTPLHCELEILQLQRDGLKWKKLAISHGLFVHLSFPNHFCRL